MRMFIPESLPLISVYDRSGTVKVYRSQNGPKFKMPAWLLIDNRTASAAEILAGILQYYRFTRLIGEKSYGKFASQTIFPLSGGGELWLTTLMIRLPDNILRVGSGVKPDIPYSDISITKMGDIIRRMSKEIISPN